MQRANQSRLPPHHVERARLTDVCVDAGVVIVEAAGGYGKSVFGAELVDHWGVVPIWVLLEPGGVSARLLVARLHAALQSAGFSGAAGLLAAAGDDPVGAIDAMLLALEDEACAIVIDDAHHADADALSLIERLAERVAEPQRLVVLTRHLPASLLKLRRPPAVVLSAVELALTLEEALSVCRRGVGLCVTADEIELLDRATSGWTAAVVLAASRCKGTGMPLTELVSIHPAHGDLMQSILEDALATSGRDGALFARIAAPPVLDAELLSEITGDQGLLEQLLAWGVPLTQTADGWWRLPDPVRERLALLGQADAEVPRIAAARYQRAGELGRALQMLLASGDTRAAASLLERADPWVIDRVDPLELLSVLDRISAETLALHGRAVLNVARCCAAAWLFEQSRPLFAWLDRLVDGEQEPELRRAVDAELITDLLNQGDPHAAEAPGRELLAAVGEDEPLTRARALTIVGQGLCWRRDDRGRIVPAALNEAADYLRRATELHLSLGNRPAAATITLYWALWIEFPLGRPQAALEILDRGLMLAAENRWRAQRIRLCRAQVLSDLGREDDAEDDLAEVERVARQLGDKVMLAYVDWLRMLSASLRGDAVGTLRHARQTEAQRNEFWWGHEGATFLAESADALDRVGHTALAAEQLERARLDPQSAEPQIAMAECALLARHGDPELAAQKLAEVEFHGIAPRESWRVTLLTAYAAYRRGDADAGVLAARAFEEAAQLGNATAPMLRERDLCEALLGLAAETGMPAALELAQHSALPGTVSVLGRFELSFGGRRVALGSGQETRLLKLVAASGGAVHVEHAIEALWPEVAPAAGRNRLRTVLNRLRDVAPDVVIREGERLELGPEVRLDLTQFEAEARQALSIGSADPVHAVAVARSAIARYRGALLPFDPYEEWAEEPREHARHTMLELLDLCAEAAAQRGDLDEARRTVERTIELAPYDDDRYLRVAAILHDQGRKGAALSVLRRARAALAQLGIDLPRPLAEFERTIAVSGLEQPPPVDSETAAPR